MEYRFCVVRSPLLIVLACLLHLAAVSALYKSAMPMAGVIVMAPLLLVHAVYVLHHAGLKASMAVVSVDFDEAGALLELHNRRRIPVTVSDIYCTSWLQVVRFQRNSLAFGSAYWLVVMPDSADADSRRRLRACLLSLPLQRQGCSTQARD